MSESSEPNSSVSSEAIHRRLDGIDQMLIGLIPRPERLAIVADLEKRIREIAASDPDYRIEAQTALPSVKPVEANGAQTLDGAANKTQPRRRSKLALTSGISGIVSLVMLFLTPIVIGVISLYGDSLESTWGETAAAIVMVGQVLTVALGGFLAVAMGIAGAVVVSQHRSRLVGTGWAATGLCTGIMPMLLGGLLCLVVGIPSAMVLTGMANVHQATTSTDLALAPSKDSPTYGPSSLAPSAPTPLLAPPLPATYPGVPTPIYGQPPSYASPPMYAPTPAPLVAPPPLPNLPSNGNPPSLPSMAPVNSNDPPSHNPSATPEASPSVPSALPSIPNTLPTPTKPEAVSPTPNLSA